MNATPTKPTIMKGSIPNAPDCRARPIGAWFSIDDRMKGPTMSETDWRAHAGTTFRCEKQPATGTRGMMVTNHPLASAAGAEMLAAGGNAIDAAIAAFFTLSVVEPMMVGVLGGGMAHIRLADGRHVVIDNQSMAPLATGPTTYTPDPKAAPGTMDV